MRSRTSRYYDGTGSTNRQIGSLLPGIIQKLERSVSNQSSLVFSLWPSVIGKELAPMTEVVSYGEGILVVKVKNSTLYSLLSQRDKPRIIQKLREKLPKTEFKNVIFKIG